MTQITSLFNVKFTFLHIAAFFIIICYHNIYIFTEESVLLFCFIAWLNITWNYVAPQINEFLEERRKKISSNFQHVSNNNIITWKKYRQGYSFKTVHAKVLISLIPYLIQLIKTFLFLQSQSRTLQSITPYLKRLHLVKELEKKLTKISYITICKRIQKMAAMRNFYSNQLKIKSFRSESKLDFFERVKKLEVGC
uniref:ATP synthase F0 subunit b n=1 Tax=Pyropia seriata TaxID=79731 RepID=UPI00286AA767|nr:ATP synthase F0 subunit b [Neoporphyra seriata]WKD83591.1 ATP synthase F0 subunit b [Neoporphyra seriata]